MAEPLRAEERVDLGQPLVAAEPEMRGDHLEPRPADLDRGPQGAAGLDKGPKPNAWQRPRLDELRGPGGEDGVAVLLLHHLQRRMEEHVHAEFARDGMGLVDAARADPAHIELLEATMSGRHGAMTLAIRCGDRWPSMPMQRCTL